LASPSQNRKEDSTTDHTEYTDEEFMRKPMGVIGCMTNDAAQIVMTMTAA